MGDKGRKHRIEPRDGGPDMVQLVTPEGERVSDERYDAIADALTTQDLQGFYRDMVLVRRIDNEATALQRQGELGLWAPCLGQVAAQVGSGRALRDWDARVSAALNNHVLPRSLPLSGRRLSAPSTIGRASV